jgi:hypothetical protein
VSRIKEERKETKALIDWFYEAKRGKEVAQAASIMQRIDNDLLPSAQKSYEGAVKFCSIIAKFRQEADTRFKRERETADPKARKALQQVKKRWSANPAPLKTGDRRELGILAMLRDKKVRATWAIKGAAAAGYWEAARGADRPLFDETWQGCLTAREIRSHLAVTYGIDVAGDKDAKEIRRACKNLGLRLAEDQRGRKYKLPSLKKEESKRPRGRPREKVDVIFSREPEAFEVEKSRTPAGEPSYGWREKNQRELELYKKELAKISSEINKLETIRGARKGLYVF